MKPIVRWTATLGMAASLIGVFGLVPSFADHRDNDRRREHVQRELEDIRRDEQRLLTLVRQQQYADRHHHWDDVRRLDRQINALREHIERDRRHVREEFRENRRDHDWDDRYDRNDRNWDDRYDRNGRYDNDRYDRNHGSNSGWRNGEHH